MARFGHCLNRVLPHLVTVSDENNTPTLWKKKIFAPPLWMKVLSQCNKEVYDEKKQAAASMKNLYCFQSFQHSLTRHGKYNQAYEYFFHIIYNL